MHGHELLEQIAAFVLVASGALFLVAAWLVRKQAIQSHAGARPQMAAVDDGSAAAAARAVAATLSFGAAVIHAAVVPHHLAEFPPYGIAFAGLAVVQLAIGIALLRGGWRPVRWPVIVLTMGVIAVWIASRTMGLPFGPEAWRPEEIGTADVVASAFEIGLVIMLVFGRRVGLQADPADHSANVLGSIVVIPLIGALGVTAVLVAASAMGDASHGDHQDDHHGMVMVSVVRALPDRYR